MTLIALGWYWSRINGSRVAHLVPRRVGPLSRSACNRFPLAEATLEPAIGLLTAVEQCGVCARKEGDAA